MMQELANMRPFQFSLLFAAAVVINHAWSCSNANWWKSFDRKGYSNCRSKSTYINGFYRSARTSSDPIYHLEEARCCPRPRPYWNQPTDCQIADWWKSFDRRGWSTCPSGFFLQGLYRTSGNYLSNIEYGKCCKPANHPYLYGHCYNQNVGSSFDKKGWSRCGDGYFITGLYRSSGNHLYNLEEFKCCKMYPGTKRAKQPKRSMPFQDPAENPDDAPHVNTKPPEVHIFNNRREKKSIPQEKPAGV